MENALNKPNLILTKNNKFNERKSLRQGRNFGEERFSIDDKTFIQEGSSVFELLDFRKTEQKHSPKEPSVKFK